MGMLNLKAYNGKELQNFISVINQMEQAGITDIRYVREQLQSFLFKRKKDFKIHLVKNKQSRRHVKKQIKEESRCPSCKKGILQEVKVQNELIAICKKCRYSEYVKEI